MLAIFLVCLNGGRGLLAWMVQTAVSLPLATATTTTTTMYCTLVRLSPHQWKFIIDLVVILLGCRRYQVFEK